MFRVCVQRYYAKASGKVCTPEPVQGGLRGRTRGGLGSSCILLLLKLLCSYFSTVCVVPNFTQTSVEIVVCPLSPKRVVDVVVVVSEKSRTLCASVLEF